MEDKIKQIIVIRKDLNMRKGKMCAQASHASMKFIVDQLREATCFGGLEFKPVEIKWMNESFTKICVSVNSLEEFEEIKQRAMGADLRVCEIEDNGATEFHGIRTKTAMAIGPDYSSKIDPITGGLSLL